MAAEHIVQLLIQERDRLSRAIEALQGSPEKRRGRPAKKPVVTATIAVPEAIPEATLEAPIKKRKPFSAAAASQMAASAITRHFHSDALGINPFSAPRLDEQHPLGLDHQERLARYATSEQAERSLTSTFPRRS
jgi:hypothetical protein